MCYDTVVMATQDEEPDPPIAIKIMEWYTLNTSDEQDGSDGSDGSEDSDGNPKPKQTRETYKILIFGKDTRGDSVCVKVKDFPTHFYLSLPQKWVKRPGKIHKPWLQNFTDKLTKGIPSRVEGSDPYSEYTPKVKRSYILQEKHAKSITGTDLVWRKKFRGFTNGKKFPFLRLNFDNSFSMRKCIDLFVERKNLDDGTQLRLPRGNRPDKMAPGETFLPRLMRPGETMA